MQRTSKRITVLVGIAMSLAACDAETTADKKSTSGQDLAVSLEWDVSGDSSVTSYRIFVGASATETGSLLQTVDATAVTFEPLAPKVTLDTESDATLAEFKGKTACFALSALNEGGGESDRTAPVCVVLSL